MTTVSRTYDNVFADFFPELSNKHTQLNILLRKWENKQKRSKNYHFEAFNHDGFLTDNTSDTVLYIINDKMKFFKQGHEMQQYIVRNTNGTLNHSNVAYMLWNKTNNKNININEYSKKYKKFILAELYILKPVLIVVCDGNYDIIRAILEDKRNAEMTKLFKIPPILNMAPMNMAVASKREFLLWFKYLYDKVVRKCQN